jgi:hypothetical protein
VFQRQEDGKWTVLVQNDGYCVVVAAERYKRFLERKKMQDHLDKFVAFQDLCERLLHDYYRWLERGFGTRGWMADQEHRCLGGFNNNHLMDAVVFFQEACYMADRPRNLSQRLRRLANNKVESLVAAESPDLVIKILRRIFVARRTLDCRGRQWSNELVERLATLSTEHYAPNHELISFWKNLAIALHGDTWSNHIEVISRLYRDTMQRKCAPYENFVIDAVYIHPDFDPGVDRADALWSLHDLVLAEQKLRTQLHPEDVDLLHQIRQSLCRIDLEWCLACCIQTQKDAAQLDQVRMILLRIAREGDKNQRARAFRRLFLLEGGNVDPGVPAGHLQDAITMLGKSHTERVRYRGIIKYLRLLVEFLEEAPSAGSTGNCWSVNDCREMIDDLIKSYERL